MSKQGVEISAAVRIQTAQRRKSAIALSERRRRLKALERRNSVEMAAIAIQRVSRGRVVRNKHKLSIEVRAFACGSVGRRAGVGVLMLCMASGSGSIANGLKIVWQGWGGVGWDRVGWAEVG